MRKIGFVTPWFGMDIPGGAEAELRELVLHLKNTKLEFEILTTCVHSFNSDWSKNYYRAGIYHEEEILVRRFSADRRNTKVFDQINARLMRGELVPRSEQEIFVQEMVNSTDLYKYMRQHDEEYSLFVFIPYMFGTTYYGVQINPSKAVLIPCFHDESYFYMDIFKEVYSKAAGIIYNAKPEKELTEKNYRVDRAHQTVMGIGLDTDISGNAKSFRQKYGLENPYILYAGRKDKGKNVDTLLRYFEEYIHRHENSDLHLVLIGGGEIEIAKTIIDRVHDLGFVDTQDKYDAYAAAELLCQPSKNESFSLVIMESWLCGRPVLVHGGCAVTRNFVHESNGGLYFDNYFEFEGCLDYLLKNKETALEMGNLGNKYVRDNFSWDIIKERYLQFFEEIKQRYRGVKNI